MENQGNRYVIELMKNIDKEVEIYMTKEDYDNKTPVIIGNCKAIDFSNLNVIIMTDEHKLVINGPFMILRKRENPGLGG